MSSILKSKWVKAYAAAALVDVSVASYSAGKKEVDYRQNMQIAKLTKDDALAAARRGCKYEAVIRIGRAIVWPWDLLNTHIYPRIVVFKPDNLLHRAYPGKP